jgi:hypothetical protein
MKKKMQYAMIAGPLLLMCLFVSCTRCDSTPGVMLESKSHQYTAFTRGSNCGPLLSEFDSFVEIEHPYFIGGHKVWTARKTVAGGKLGLDKLILKWEDDRHLSVDCRCQGEPLDFTLGQWKDVAITYTFSSLSGRRGGTGWQEKAGKR